MRREEIYEWSKWKEVKVHRPACKFCHYFEPSLSDPEGGYCFVRKKLLVDGDVDYKKFNDKCSYFEERQGGGFLYSIGENMKEEEEEIKL